MTPDKIVSIIEGYERRLNNEGVPKIRMNPNRTFASLSKEGCLAHAHFLCDGVKIYASDPERQRKAGSHLTAIQMCLSFAGWYTLEEIMNHNYEL